MMPFCSLFMGWASYFN